MELSERVRVVGRVVRRDAKARETAGRRLLAAAALTLFLVGLLSAMGLSLLVLPVLVAAVLAGIAGAATALLEGSGAFVPPGSPREPRIARLGSGGHVVARVGNGVRGEIGIRVPRFAGTIRRAFGRADAACERAAKGIRQLVAGRLTRLRAGAAARPARPEPNARLRQASRLNAQGSQLRREGRYALAAERHRAALTLLRALGDRRGEALTLNNLALALEHAGDNRTAVGLFEESARILGELRDDESEGQVIANLGLAQRRWGHPEEAASLLQDALEKLSPDSRAYRAVEAELARAS